MVQMTITRANATQLAILFVLLSTPFYAFGSLPSAVLKETADHVHLGPRLNVQLQEDGIELLLVLRVDFSDQPGRRLRHEIDERLFNENAVSLASYMSEVSYGQMSVQPGPDGGSYPLNNAWYRAPKPMAYYGQGDISPPRYRELVEDALDAALNDLSLSHYDRDNDGVLDHLVILHAGNDQVVTGSEPDIWSALLPALSLVRQGIRIESAMIIAEDPDRKHPLVGIWCHEFMHSLGAPDIYGSRLTATPNDNQFSLMGRRGVFQGGGLQPSHICGYLKWDIDGNPENGRSGWIEPIEIRGGGLFKIDALSQPNKRQVLYKIDVPNTGGREFFLIENRTAAAMYDSDLPDEGLLIWHIDEKIPIGDNEPTIARRIWLEDPADPTHERLLDGSGNLIVTEGAAYSAEDMQTAFTPWTQPSSHGNSGEATGMSIVGVSTSGRTMTFYAFLGETFEPNDAPNEAAPIPLNLTIHSEIQGADDVDHFRIAGPMNAQTLFLASMPPGTPLSMTLLNSAGRTVSSALRIAGAESDQLQMRYFSQSAELLTLRVAPTAALTETVPYQLRTQTETGSGQPPQFVSLRIYPNPAPLGVPIRAHASLSQAPIDRAEAVVLDAQGKRALRMELTDLSSGDALFQFHNALAPGVYFMLVSVEQNERKLQRIGKFAVR